MSSCHSFVDVRVFLRCVMASTSRSTKFLIGTRRTMRPRIVIDRNYLSTFTYWLVKIISQKNRLKPPPEEKNQLRKLRMFHTRSTGLVAPSLNPVVKSRYEILGDLSWYIFGHKPCGGSGLATTIAGRNSRLTIGLFLWLCNDHFPLYSNYIVFSLLTMCI